MQSDSCAKPSHAYTAEGEKESMALDSAKILKRVLNANTHRRCYTNWPGYVQSIFRSLIQKFKQLFAPFSEESFATDEYGKFLHWITQSWLVKISFNILRHCQLYFPANLHNISFIQTQRNWLYTCRDLYTSNLLDVTKLSKYDTKLQIVTGGAVVDLQC